MTALAALRRHWPLVAAAASAAMLATAHVFQAMGYAPCNLCLRQREVYWAALAAGLVGYGFARLRRLEPAVVNLILAALFVTGAVVAAFHAGVEWKWWPGPTTCVTGGLGAIATSDLTALLDGTAKVRPPACDEAAWRLFGLSMAGWNALASLALAAISASFVRGETRA